MPEQQTSIEPRQTKAVVKWRGTDVTVTFQHVKQNICPQATDQEVVMFLKLCESLQLNPLVNEVYLVKYSQTDKAAVVVAIGSYLKAAETNDQYDGHEAGIILKGATHAVECREGSFLLTEEMQGLVGGWARVYRKDRGRSVYVTVSKAECVKLTREGKPTKHWAPEHQPWMLRKVALKRALVESFPSLFADTISSAEISDEDEESLSRDALPRAFEKEGKPDWRRFWVKVKSDFKLTQEQARELLQVESIKKDLIDQGVTMEEMWEKLVQAVQQKHQHVEPETLEVITPEHWPPEADSTVLVDQETGEVITPERVQTEQSDIIDGEVSEVPEAKSRIDMNWLRESLEEMNWNDVGKWLRTRYKNATGKKVRELVESLTPEQQEEFVQQVQDRLVIYRSQHQKKG